MEWLWLDPVENEAEWLAPDEWRRIESAAKEDT
jgi:hypothetical protein